MLALKQRTKQTSSNQTPDTNRVWFAIKVFPVDVGVYYGMKWVRVVILLQTVALY